MVYATNNYSCPNIYVLSISVPCVHHEVAMQLTCSLISSIWSTPAYSRPITSHHVTSHMTAVTCLFIINKKKEIQKKRNIKSRTIDKRKRKRKKNSSHMYHNNKLLTDMILENSQNFDILLIQEPSQSVIQQLPSSLSKEGENLIKFPHYSSWIIFTRLSCQNCKK